MSNNFTLDRRVVTLGLEAKDKNEAIEMIAKTLRDAGYVKDSYINAIIEREKVFPTGLPTGEYGVAIPHTDVEHVNTPMVAVATLKNPVDFCVMGSCDGETIPVKIMFMLAMKDGNAQIHLLTNIMSVIQDSELLKKIYEAKTGEELLALVGDKINI